MKIEEPCVLSRDLSNIFPGHPPKPVGHINTADEILPSSLDPYNNCHWSEKIDEHRVILFNGIAFSRVGDLYSKMPEEYTHKVARWLEQCFKDHEYFVFDVGIVAHTRAKGRVYLYDIPQHRGTFRERNELMRSHEDMLDTHEEIRLFLPTDCTDLGKTPDELYFWSQERWGFLKSYNEPLSEGVVGKPWDHIYNWSRTEALAKKEGWLKIRHA